MSGADALQLTCDSETTTLLTRRTESEGRMRSEAIFRAKKTIDNKYELCQAAAKTTRRMHVASSDTQTTITRAFETIAEDAKVLGVERVA